MQCRVCRGFHCEETTMDLGEVIPSDGKTLYDYFNDCTQLKATNYDHLPKKLCISCTQSLHQAYGFIQEARKSDEELRKILPLTKNEPVSIYSDQEELLEELQEKIQTEKPYASYALEIKTLKQIPGSTKNKSRLVYEPTEQSEDIEDMLDASTFDPLSVTRGKSGESAKTVADASVGDPEQLNIIKEEIKIELSSDVFDDCNAERFVESSVNDDTDESCDIDEFKHRKKRSYVCDFCVYKCRTQYVLKKHIFELHKDKITCEKCCKVFEVPAQMKLHNKLVHETRSRMSCNWCKNSDRMPKDELIMHIKNSHPSIHSKYFPRTRVLGRAEDDPFPCERCPKMFKTIYELAEHKQEHKYDCPLCYMIFKKDSSYRTHVLRSHKLTITQLKDIINGNEDPNMQLQQKLREEEQEKLLKKEEKRNRKQEKPYQCPLCFKEFDKPSSSSSHMVRTHNLTLTKVKEIVNGNDDVSMLLVLPEHQQQQPEQEEQQHQLKQPDQEQQQQLEQKQQQQLRRPEQQAENQKQENHNQEIYYECPLCSESFQQGSSFSSHVLSTHKLTLARLKEVVHVNVNINLECQKLEQQQQDQQQRESSKYECPLCLRGFQNANSYSSHVYRTHNITLTKLKQQLKLKRKPQNKNKRRQKEGSISNNESQSDIICIGEEQDSYRDVEPFETMWEMECSNSSQERPKHNSELTELQEVGNVNKDINIQDGQQAEQQSQQRDQQQENHIQNPKYECPLCLKGFENANTYSSHVYRKHNTTLTKLKDQIKLKTKPQKQNKSKHKKSSKSNIASKNYVNCIEAEQELEIDRPSTQTHKDEVEKTETMCDIERSYTLHEHDFNEDGNVDEDINVDDEQQVEQQKTMPQKQNKIKDKESSMSNVSKSEFKEIVNVDEDVNIHDDQQTELQTEQQSYQQQHTQKPKHECPLCLREFERTGTFSSHLSKKHNLTLTKLKEQLKLKTKTQKKNNSKDTESSMSNVSLDDIINIDEERNSANDVLSDQVTYKDDIEKSETMWEMESESESELVECTKYCHKKIPAIYLLEHEREHAEKLRLASEAAPPSKKEREYICSYCCQIFKTEFYVKLHEKKVHLCDIESERKECPICKKKFEKRYLRSHLSNVHTAGEKFPCEICGDLFKSNLSLKNHRKLHLERKFQCTMCDKGFIRRAVLKVHMRSHTGEEPYVCQICDQRFKTKIRLDYHLQRHAGIKHKCKVCDKEFNRADQLRIHSYKHTGMPYQCTICEYKTGKREMFTSHLRKRHEKVMTNDELAEMFKKNTGRYPRVWLAKPAETMDEGTQEADYSN
ncbi:zinc finger protein 91-like [Eurosta solidaginis]|uniref:zinc finger protein 91-like n=1 Tax=Eurosta solidaginis TaxID=178769 RepID=UPI003530DD51